MKISTETDNYSPKARTSPRIDGIDLVCVDEMIAEADRILSKLVDEVDYRNFDIYRKRAQLRYAAGDDAITVIDDLFMAARCLHGKGEYHLSLKPPEMFMTRRVIPVELGIISGLPMLTLEISSTFGLPLMMIMAKSAPEDVMSEANLISSYFRRDFCADFVELAGMSALVYAGALASVGRGYEDEATLALRTYAKARDGLRGSPPASVLPKLRRYDGLCAALASVCNRDVDGFVVIASDIAEEFRQSESARSAKYSAPTSIDAIPNYFDNSLLSLMALLILSGQSLSLPEHGALARYRDLIAAFTEMPERHIEAEEIDEESREILRNAGVDVDALQDPYLRNNTRRTLEEKEEKAAEINREKERTAQEEARRLAAKRRSAEIAEKLSRESASIAEEDEGERTAFSHFFDDEDQEDEKLRNFVDDAYNDAAEQIPGRDFSAFFDDEPESLASIESPKVESPRKAVRSMEGFFDDADEVPRFEEAVEVEAPVVRSYDANFFDEEATFVSDLKMEAEPEEVVSHAVETEAAADAVEEAVVAPKVGKDYSAFFDESYKKPQYLRMESESRTESEEKEDEEALKRKREAAEKIEAMRKAQMEELMEAQREKMRILSEERNKLSLEEMSEQANEVEVSMTQEERIAQILKEKEKGLMERALRERELAAQNLEELKKAASVPSVAKLKLVADKEEEEIVMPQGEEIAVSPFSYSELDRIHDNTALRQDEEEDPEIRIDAFRDKEDVDIQDDGDDDLLIVKNDYENSV